MDGYFAPDEGKAPDTEKLLKVVIMPEGNKNHLLGKEFCFEALYDS